MINDCNALCLLTIIITRTAWKSIYTGMTRILRNNHNHDNYTLYNIKTAKLLLVLALSSLLNPTVISSMADLTSTKKA